MALAKAEGIELTKEEAEAYLAELEDFELDITKEEAEAYLAEMNDVELDETALKKVAGGVCYFEACPEQCPDFSTQLRMTHY